MHAHSSNDFLSEVLQDLRFTNNSYGRCELRRPWGIDFAAQAEARFHFVAAGACWLHAPAERGRRKWIPLAQGDVVLLPRGTHHALAHKPAVRVKPLEEMPLEEIGERTYRIEAGGAGAKTVLVCCSVGFGEAAVHPLLELMPSTLLVRAASERDRALPALLEAMAEEVLAPRVGAALVMARLADVVITRVIRDPQIGRAPAAIHRAPGDPWSVESLADVAKTSRSTFAERFASVVGVTPARYLARWRMHVASGWLKTERMGVAEAASMLGYDSEAAFSRAFKRFVGVPPSAMRRAS